MTIDSVNYIDCENMVNGDLNKMRIAKLANCLGNPKQNV